MEQKEEKKRRNRRTKVEIENGIKNAAIEEILEHGFSQSLVTSIIKRAKIEPIVFYNRYKDLSVFYDEIVRDCDYWFSDIASEAQKQVTDREQCRSLLQGLFKSLSEKSIMLELLRWEVTEINDTTRRTAMMREVMTIPLANNYDKLFYGTGIDFMGLSSLILGGIYYLSLHRNVSPFYGIDINSPLGKQRISNALNQYTDLVFSIFSKRNEKIRYAENMRKAGIDEDTIKKCLEIA